MGTTSKIIYKCKKTGEKFRFEKISYGLYWKIVGDERIMLKQQEVKKNYIFCKRDSKTGWHKTNAIIFK